MNQDELLQLQDQARAASTLLKAMSNEHRLLILCRLLGCERSVGELERLVGLSQSALSQHLARLRRDDLVKTRREAQTIYYSLKGDAVASVLSTLYALYCAPPSDAPRHDAPRHDDSGTMNHSGGHPDAPTGHAQPMTGRSPTGPSTPRRVTAGRLQSSSSHTASPAARASLDSSRD